MARKVFVDVVTRTDVDGVVHPISITWEDGTIYLIDKVMDVRMAASLKAGGQGIRYLCSIDNKSTYLFYEYPRWFVEAKE